MVRRASTTLALLTFVLLIKGEKSLSLSLHGCFKSHFRSSQQTCHVCNDHHTATRSDDALLRRDELLRWLMVRTRSTTTVVAALTLGVTIHRPLSLALEAPLLPSSSSVIASQEEKGGTLQVFQTSSGLKYIDLKKGDPRTSTANNNSSNNNNNNTTASTPRYGQLLSISYKSYVTLPGGKPQLFDSSDAYLLKHGNGRNIAGLDEGLHTMSVGGTRRLLIPPKLGYVVSGLGPMPVYPWARDKLNNLLDQMIEKRGGTVVMEVTLRSMIDDEADQGYYEDASLSPEDFETLKTNLQRKAFEARRTSDAAL